MLQDAKRSGQQSRTRDGPTLLHSHDGDLALWRVRRKALLKYACHVVLCILLRKGVMDAKARERPRSANGAAGKRAQGGPCAPLAFA